MRYCDKCKLNIEDHLNYCPLCGRCVGDSTSKSVLKNYPTVDKPKVSNNYTIHVVTWSLILINILALALELIISQSINYYWHILAVTLLIMFGVLSPIKRSWSFNGSLSVFMVMLSGYLLFLELYTFSYGWGVQYVIPLFVFAIAIYEIIMTSIQKFNRLESISVLITCFLESLGVFLYNYLTSSITWPSLIGTFISFAFLFVLFIAKYKKTRKELQKSFHI